MKVRKEAVSEGDCTLLGKVVTMTFSNNIRLMRMLQHAVAASFRCCRELHSVIVILDIYPCSASSLTVSKWHILRKTSLIKEKYL